MSRWLLGGLGMIIITVGSALWLGLDESAEGIDEPAVRRAKVVTAPSSPPLTPRKQASTAAVSTDTPAKADERRRQAPGPSTDQGAVHRFVADTVVRELYEEASRCYKGQRGGHDSIQVGYRLNVADGRATVSEATLISSALGDRGLEDCIIDAVDDHSWEVADGFRLWEGGQEASFTVRGLEKRSRARDNRARDDVEAIP